MTSSGEGSEVLLQWKDRKVSLHLELVCPGEDPVTSESAQVVEVSDEWLTVVVAESFFRDFHLLPGSGVELVENVPQRFRKRFTKVVRVSSVERRNLF